MSNHARIRRGRSASRNLVWQDQLSQAWELPFAIYSGQLVRTLLSLHHISGRNYSFPEDEASGTHGVWGIREAVDFASGETAKTAIAPRSAPVKEWVTIG